MRIGLALPHYDYPTGDGALSWEGLVEAALRAESLGFDSAWISDHFFLDITRYGGPSGAIGTPEAFTALAALAARTSRIRLGTLVTCAPFRHPAHVAKMATAIDLASGGRFDLGIGAGWYQAEFEAFGYGFGSVGARFGALEETVEAVAALFGGGPVTYRGRQVNLVDAYNHPAPVTPGGPPIWVGGKGGDRLLRLVARSAAGWNTVWRWTVEDYRSRVQRAREIAEREDRDPSSVRLSVGLYTLLGEDERDLARRYEALQRWTPGGAIDGESLQEWSKPTLTGTVDRCVERLAEFADLGVEEMIVNPASLPFAVFDWSVVELIAAELIPRARDLEPAWSSSTPR
jgi:probable F420-dependent oxidoreductase